MIVRRWVASTTGALGLLTLLAVAMSFGPHIHARGRLVEDANIYAFFYDFVPGFDGLRVPARFAMIVALGLSALGACGTAVLARRVGRRAVFVAGALILVESIAVPLELNANATGYRHSGLAPLPASLTFAGETPEVYEFAATLPRQSALVELPFGEPAFDVRYMFYSTRHWLPLVNGYSGGAPIAHGLLGEFLADALVRPDRAWTALVESQATYAIVHEAFYAGTRGREMSGWLRVHGAREIASFGSDRIFQLVVSH